VRGEERVRVEGYKEIKSATKWPKMPIYNTLWWLATLVNGKVGWPKIHQRRYPTTKLHDGKRFCFKDPLVPLVLNYLKDCVNNTISMVSYIMLNSNKSPIAPKISNSGRPISNC